MEFKASHKHAPISARKARLVADLVRGMAVNDAIEALRTTHRRASVMLDKVIRSAVANAGQSKALGAEDLFVKESRVDEGPLAQGRMRWRPGPMGRMKPIHKRTSHIHVILGAVGDKSYRRRKPKVEATESGEE